MEVPKVQYFLARRSTLHWWWAGLHDWSYSGGTDSLWNLSGFNLGPVFCKGSHDRTFLGYGLF